MDIIIVILLLALLATIFWLASRVKSNDGQASLAGLNERLLMLAEQNRQLQTIMDTKLRETHESNRAQFSETSRILEAISRESNKTIAGVTEKLTKLDETNKQIMGFSQELNSLQDILKNPKQRGILGEYYLEEILKNTLPPANYQIQYKFKDGSIVDAAIFLKDAIIPIDSKFSLENYERLLNCKDADTKIKLEKAFKQDVKNRIDETAQYIKPSEGTTNFAFMFIPAEAIFYDLLINKVGAAQINTRDLLEYATRDKKVIIVSPTSFYAYLQTVLQGLRMMQIEESAKLIRDNVEKLSKHLVAYESYMGKLGGNLSTSVNQYNLAVGEFKKIDKDVAKITESQTQATLNTIDKPVLD